MLSQNPPEGERHPVSGGHIWSLVLPFAAVGGVVVFQYTVFVKAGVKRIEILAVETVGGDAQPFTETGRLK